MLKSHSSIYSLIDAFRKEQRRTEHNLVLLKTGVNYKRKPEYEKLDERLKNVLLTYDKTKVLEFYDNISLILLY